MAEIGNWLDRTIGFFSPQRGLARVQARAAMGLMLAYDGAGRGRVMENWYTTGNSADAEVGQYHRIMRERARDLVRNNPHATKGLNVIVANKIGTGIMCQPSDVRPDGRRQNQRVNKRTNDRWRRFMDNCDVTGRHDWYGLQSLVERTRAEAGEALVQFVPWVVSSPDDVPFRLHVLEPDFIDSDKNEVFSALHEIKYGVEYLNRRPVAYWIFETHPGDGAVGPGRRLGYQSKRVDASELLHIMKPLRPGQSRGITDFASVIVKLRALDDYDSAEVMRKKIAACMSAFVTTPAGLPGASIAPTVVDSAGDRRERFEPGMIGYLKPGESIAFNDPKPSSDYEPFNKVQLRAIAAGLGMPYELLTGDLSEVNYTSHRGGLVQFRGMVEADQWQVIVPQLCEPVCRRFTQQLARIDGLTDPDTAWTYTPPRFGLLDPSKEIPAMVDALAAGIESYPNMQRREGYDWREKMAEIKQFAEYAEAEGLDWLIPSKKEAAAPAGSARAPQEPERDQRAA